MFDPRSIRTVVLDWNDSIQDEIGEVIRKIYQMYGVQLLREDFDRYSPPLGAKVGISEEAFNQLAWLSKDVQVHAQPFPGVRQALNLMKRQGVHIKIATTSWMERQDIIDWFNRHQLPFDELIKTTSLEKVNVPGCLYVDDSPATLAQFLKFDLPALKFNLPHNRDIPCPGFDHWMSITQIFEGAN